MLFGSCRGCGPPWGSHFSAHPFSTASSQHLRWQTCRMWVPSRADVWATALCRTVSILNQCYCTPGTPHPSLTSLRLADLPESPSLLQWNFEAMLRKCRAGCSLWAPEEGSLPQMKSGAMAEDQHLPLPALGMKVRGHMMGWGGLILDYAERQSKQHPPLGTRPGSPLLWAVCSGGCVIPKGRAEAVMI